MKRIMVRYKVKPERVKENEALIAKAFEEMHRAKPAGLRYASFKLEDGVSFVHIVAMEEGGASPGDFAAFKAFTAAIKERCDEPPVASGLTEIGSYRFFGG